MGKWTLVVAAFAFATGAAPAPPPSGDTQARLEQAGRLSEMADRSAEAGDRGSAIAIGRKALKLVDEALAAGADPAKVDPGRRMIQLDLADRLLAAQKWDEALAEYRDAAKVRGGGFDAYVRVRALKGIVGAQGSRGQTGAACAALADLIGQGRAMLASDPHNVFLTRQLAELLEADTIVRYFTGNGDVAMRASAGETLALFRAVSSANPDSAEARRAVFTWDWVNAKLSNHIDLWREALEDGEWLDARHELKGREPLLAEIKAKVEKYDRTGTLTIGD